VCLRLLFWRREESKHFRAKASPVGRDRDNRRREDFGGRCGVTGLSVRELLIASRILPWGIHTAERLDVRNGICLSRLHDADLHRGLITFDAKLRLILSPRLKAELPQRSVAENFGAYSGEALHFADDAVLPGGEFLAAHRAKVFKAAQLAIRFPCGASCLTSFSFPMSAEEHPDEGPVTDPEELERVMKLAGEDPSLTGVLMRLLLGARLWIFVPGHPELEGEHIRDVSEGFTWCMYRDSNGDFAAVFTSLRAAQDERRNSLHGTKEKPAMVEVPARVLFHFLNNGRTTVRVMAFNGATLRLDPEAIGPLLEGKMSEAQPPPPPPPGTGGSMLMVPVPPDEVPSKLRQAIRVFCTQHQGAIAVYVCHPQDEKTGRIDELDLRVVLRLRDNPGYFYNDFQIMVQKMTPKPYDAYTGVPSAEQWEQPQMEFLRKATPVWPVMHKG
jgi:hypothetical protein